METVRLTVQMRDHDNRTRVTLHRDVPLDRVAERAAEIASRAVSFYRREKKTAAAVAAGERS